MTQKDVITISNETIEVLKNFSHINDGILIQPGSQIKTMAIGKHIQAVADVSETFPIEFGIYGLSEFLGAISLFKTPEFKFNEKCVTISEDKAKINYFYGSPAGIVSPKNDVKMPDDCEIVVELHKHVLEALVKASSILGVAYFAIVSDGKTINAKVYNKTSDNSVGNSFDFELGEGNGDVYEQVWKVEHLALIPGDYDLRIKANKISEFKHKQKKITYWVAIQDGTYTPKS